VLIPYAHSAAQIILLMTLGNALNALVNNVYWSVVIDVSPKASVGTYSGMTLAIANIASILAPTLSGYLAQYQGYGAMFTATAAVSFCSMLCMILLQPEKPMSAERVSQTGSIALADK